MILKGSRDLIAPLPHEERNGCLNHLEVNYSILSLYYSRDPSNTTDNVCCCFRAPANGIETPYLRKLKFDRLEGGGGNWLGG